MSDSTERKGGAVKLSEAQRKVLSYAATRRGTVESAAATLNMRVSDVSRVRNLLRDYGLLHGWKFYGERMSATDAGRSALSPSGGNTP